MKKRKLPTVNCRLSTLLMVLFLLAMTALPAFGATGDLVVDKAHLLTGSELSQLQDRARAMSDLYDCDVAVLTVELFRGYSDIDSYAENIFREYGFGRGAQEDLVMLLLSMEERDFCILARGFGNTAFTDYGKEKMEDYFLPALGGGDYYEGFSAFIDVSGDYLRQARSGNPVDVTEYNGSGGGISGGSNGSGDSYGSGGGSAIGQYTGRMSPGMKAVLVLLFSVGPAGIFCLIQNGKMKTAKAARGAGTYIPPGGLRITRQQDQFLYRTETRRRIPQPSESGGSSGSSSGSSGGGSSGGGGTTVHSSGSSTHSGKF